MPPSPTTSQKKSREKFLAGKNCQWCHTTTNLIIYQQKYYQDLQKRKIIEKKVIREMIKTKMIQGEIAAQKETHTFFLCISCQHETKLRRKNQKTITCIGCAQKFKISEIQLVRREILNTFLPPNEYYHFITKFQKNIEQELEKRGLPQVTFPTDIIPKNLENVLVLCNRCHFAKQKGKILCKKCLEHYHSPRYDNCFECQPESFKENYYKSIESQLRLEITQIIQQLQEMGMNPEAKSIQIIIDDPNLTIREIENRVAGLLEQIESKKKD